MELEQLPVQYPKNSVSRLRAESKKPAHTTTQIIRIEQLRPTQMAVGMRAVTFKRRKLEHRATKRRPLKKLALERAIPAIRGPGGEVFMVDNHHFGLAMWQAEQRKAQVVILGDLAHLSNDEFWSQMESSGLLYPFDESGNRVDPEELPLWLHSLRHDPFRDLAWSVREAGGFRKVRVPFVEFRWANYFRNHIPLECLRDSYSSAVRKAMKLSRSSDAKRLPGYVD